LENPHILRLLAVVAGLVFVGDLATYRTDTFRAWWVTTRNTFNQDFVAAFEAEYELAPRA
jgi:hypothetical protein